jgi:DNA-binding NarL/FixJ family response regulator
MDPVMREAIDASLRHVNRKPVFLTTAQFCVYRLAVAGLSNQDIAMVTGRAEKTVKAHMTDILKKLNLGTRHQLIVAFFTQSIIVIREQEGV